MIPTLRISSVLLCLLVSFSIIANNIRFNNLSVKDGLSHVTVYAIYQDEVGAMWFGTLEGVDRYNGNTVTAYHPEAGGSGLTKNEIMAICGDRNGAVFIQALHNLVMYDLRSESFERLLTDSVFNICHSNGQLWVLTTNRLLSRADRGSRFSEIHKFERANTGYRAMCVDGERIYIGGNTGISVLPIDGCGEAEILLEGEDVRALYSDSNGRLWAGTATSGVYCITKTGETTHYLHDPANENSLSDNQVRCIVEDDAGNIWVGTYRGLNRYNPVEQKWIRFMQLDSSGLFTSQPSVFSLYKDDHGYIWAGTYYGGVSYCNPTSAYSTTHLADSSQPGALNYAISGMMTLDASGNLWVCTEGGGLNRFDKTSGNFQSIPSPGKRLTNLKGIEFHPGTNRLYAGTHEGGLLVVEAATNSMRIIDTTNGLPDNSILGLQLYGDRLLIATRSGITALDISTEHFEPLSADSLVNATFDGGAYESFLLDRDNNLWLPDWSGGVLMVDIVNGKTKYFNSSEIGNTGNFRIVDVFEASNGTIYFATVGSGVLAFNPHTSEFRTITRRDNSLYSDYCYFLAETNSGDLAVLHNNAVSFIDSTHDNLRNIFRTSDISFCHGSGILCAPDGTIYLSGIGGVEVIDPAMASAAKGADRNYYFDRLTVNNRVIQPGDDSGILAESLPLTDKIILPHNRNNLTIDVGTTVFDSEQNRYEYRLDGFNDAWLPLYSNKISYTNLRPGSYTLTIRKLNSENSVCSENSLDVVVRPPFYANIYAYVVYILLLVGIIYIIVRNKTRQAALRAAVEYERKEKERIDELDKAKMRFFTNISHEFRTPLTLAIAHLESLLQLDSITPVVYNRLLKIYRSVSHLTNLITELLDIQKQVQGAVHLRVRLTDIVAFTKDIYLYFEEYARSKQIEYNFESSLERVEIMLDSKHFRKVIMNLLSNAFKYTADGGRIAVAVKAVGSNVNIIVSDSGSGIPKESIEKIFDRFYQVDERSSNFSSGTGIGLSLAKGIVELHHGTLEVESEVGKGSTFTVTLPIDASLYKSEEIDNGGADALVCDKPNAVNLCEREVPGNIPEPENKPVVLVVDDNEDVLSVLTEIFAPFYDVRIAHDGNEGLELAKSLLPDLIVSDVMMPGISGKKMCYKLKQNVATSHIPIVLLTAQSAVEYAVEGYMFGADDYIVKPFNVQLLLARCQNLIRTRRMLFERFRNGLGGSPHTEQSPAGEGISGADKGFLEKAMKVIASNFSNQEFNMDILAGELGIGRNKLYARIKSISGLTPNELTLNMKLNESMRLLDDNPELNISEIAIRLGFSSTQYFSKCFKSVYGMAPLNYRNRNKKETPDIHSTVAD